MSRYWTRRPLWESIPVDVVDAVQNALGARVVSATTASGGFSPGFAGVVTTDDRSRYFVKVAQVANAADTVAIHRREWDVLSLLPRRLPVPAPIAFVDSGDAVALISDAVDGSLPALPWREDDLRSAFEAYESLGSWTVADGDLVDAPNELSAGFAGWVRISALSEPTDAVPGLSLTGIELDRLRTWAEGGAEAVAGSRLVHLDARSDNLLRNPGSPTIVVDWPWAARGAPWLDPLTILVEVLVADPTADVDRLRREHPLLSSVSDHALASVLAGLAALFIESARRPAPPAIPGLRPFQLAQGVTIIGWLRRSFALT